MPLYDYLCKKCDKTSELLIRSSSSVPACPHCGSEELQRLLSAPVAPGKSAGILSGARTQAAKEGHLSNYKRVNGKIVD